MVTEPVNQYLISRALGSRVHPIGRTSFGGFGLVRTLAEVLKTTPGKEELAGVTEAEDRRIAKAFGRMHGGYATDRLLWNTDFRNGFLRECRGEGLVQSDEVLIRRLITIRKAPARYATKGIVLPRATKHDPRGSVSDTSLQAIEFSLVRLRYQYGVSIDDILIDAGLREGYIETAVAMDPTAEPDMLCLGALCIRKTRERAHGQLNRLEPDAIETEMVSVGPISHVGEKDLPDAPGLLEMIERDRYLFISEPQSVRDAAAPFLTGRSLATMSDLFWRPNPDVLTLRVFEGSKFHNVPVKQWQIRLIEVRRPVFNWPVHSAA